MNLNLKFASNAPLPPTVKFFPHLDRVVTVEHCYYYLSFLERFWTFMDTMTLYEQRHYLARAEVRYEKWLHNFNEGIRVPPLDVAFLWHIHALSPLRYYEDLVLRLRCNAVFDEIFPLDNLHHTANDPHMNDLNIWNQVFGEDEPYFLSPENMYDGTYSRPCYACQQEIVLPWSAYFEYRYGVNTTRFPHDGCGPAEGINFLDVARMKLESDLTNKCPGPIVAGTLLKPNGTIRKKPNKMVTKIKPLQIILPQEEMDYAYERQIQEQLKFFGKKYEYDANELLYAIRTSYQSNPTPFSIDLIHAVSRQRRFYDTIISMDWSSESDILIASIRHYHNFMATLKHQSNLHAVPTVEIDIAFHVHMLCGPQYRKFTLKHLHQVINHDDNIPENYIKEYTARWKRGIVAPPYIYMETQKTDEFIQGKIKLEWDIFGSDYYPGMVQIKNGENSSNVRQTLNLESRQDRQLQAMQVSVHSQNVDRQYSLYPSQTDLERIQNFIAKGVTQNSYGYIGSINFVSGGNSALVYEGKLVESSPSTIPATIKDNSRNKEWMNLKLILQDPVEIGFLRKTRTSEFSNREGFQRIKPIAPKNTFMDHGMASAANNNDSNSDNEHLPSYLQVANSSTRNMNSDIECIGYYDTFLSSRPKFSGPALLGPSVIFD